MTGAAASGYVTCTTAGVVVFRIAKTALRGFMDDEALELSAALAYRFFLAIVLFFIFLAALSGFITYWLNGPDVASRVQSLISSTIPSNVGGVLTEQLRSILTDREPGALSVSLVFTLWAASGATLALIQAMNRAYDVRESRPFVRKYSVAIGLTLLAAGVVILSFAVLVVARFFASSVAAFLGLGPQYEGVLGLVPLPLVFLALALGSGVLYRLGPNVSQNARAAIPGAILFAVSWLVATYGFSLYVDLFGSYQKTYGALGAVVVFLIWLYINAALLLAGAELNAAVAKVTRPAELDEQRREKQREAAREAA